MGVWPQSGHADCASLAMVTLTAFIHIEANSLDREVTVETLAFAKR